MIILYIMIYILYHESICHGLIRNCFISVVWLFYDDMNCFNTKYLWKFRTVWNWRTSAVDWLFTADIINWSYIQFVMTLLLNLLIIDLSTLLLFLNLLNSGKDEEPGLLRLITPVKRDGKPDLTDIELWPRCVPEGMIFKVILMSIFLMFMVEMYICIVRI